MEEASTLSQVLLSIKQLQESEVYQQHCRLFTEKCVQLFETAQRLIPEYDALQAACQKHTVREELAVQCRYLYRGFYCPSPVYDLIVGNARRGNILKKPNKKSKPTHRYGFDDSGRLIWCQNNEHKCYEYLVYEGSQVYGLSFDATGTFLSISEETYAGGNLISFYVADFYAAHPFECILKAELYEHDNLGLCTTKLFDFTPPFVSIPDFMKEWRTQELLCQPHCHCIGNYHFERKDGMLASYRRYDLISDNPIGEEYPVFLPRKA